MSYGVKPISKAIIDWQVLYTLFPTIRIPRKYPSEGISQPALSSTHLCSSDLGTVVGEQTGEGRQSLSIQSVSVRLSSVRVIACYLSLSLQPVMVYRRFPVVIAEVERLFRSRAVVYRRSPLWL